MPEYSSLQYKPLQFATTEYKPTIGQLQQADMNLLANSMEKKENRIREADRQKAKSRRHSAKHSPNGPQLWRYRHCHARKMHERGLRLL